ncbi:MAG: hypothetical protein JWL84_3621 [Rhodospirillales bacterium]|jgi:hypothetical protein|nr:hypothetical protein [Rhodospirillales bacterium]
MRHTMTARETTAAPMERLALHGVKVAFRLTAWILLLAVSFPSTAAARGFVSFHFGVPLVVGPPVYYAPPPVYYVPPPVYYTPPPVYTYSTAAQQQACHEYQTTAMIDGKPQPVVGTACLQADGSWRTSQ